VEASADGAHGVIAQTVSAVNTGARKVPEAIDRVADGLRTGTRGLSRAPGLVLHKIGSTELSWGRSPKSRQTHLIRSEDWKYGPNRLEACRGPTPIIGIRYGEDELSDHVDLSG
jgi:hypothetical protein